MNIEKHKYHTVKLQGCKVLGERCKGLLQGARCVGVRVGAKCRCKVTRYKALNLQRCKV
jgi:hypothetical protein